MSGKVKNRLSYGGVVFVERVKKIHVADKMVRYDSNVSATLFFSREHKNPEASEPTKPPASIDDNKNEILTAERSYISCKSSAPKSEQILNL